MLLFKLCFLGCVILLCSADSTDLAEKITEEGENHEASSFETAHKISNPPDEFQTSHKISKHPKAEHQLMENDDENDVSPLMQLQQTQNLLSTKERPELNPILSALINEDVMKSIEAKRAIEQEQLDDVAADDKNEDLVDVSLTTEVLPIVLTTSKNNLMKNAPNSNLYDTQTNLFAAGSENQKSRIQIKKGPNGMDYEYEYVYYYYDDDEGLGGGAGSIGKKQQEAESSLVQETSKRGAQPLERGKSRYTNIERSTTSAPDNALVSGKAKGRANVPSATNNDVDGGRLPAITRFPSRGNNNDAQPTISLENFQNTASASNEKSKKISVKHPSLELVDSETFNTDEKQTKGSPRNGDSEKTTPTAIMVSETAEGEPKSEKSNADENMLEEVEQTTPLMEKAALDLYAILANENLEMDMTTDMDRDSTTILPTESDEDAMTTIEIENETIIPTTPTPTPSTTTTTEPTTTPTTTTTTTTTSTPKTTTQAASLFGAGRRGGLATAGRNRFRLKSGAADPTTTSTTEAPASQAGETQSSSPGGLKGRNRFQRPSFGNRKAAITPAHASSPEAVEKEIVAKEADKPAESSPPLRGRTRNRFNLRGQITTTTAAAPSADQEQNDEINQISSTTARSLRARPTLNIRGRSRIGARPAASTQSPVITENDETATPDSAVAEAGEEKPSSASSLQSKPSRFNLNRAGGSGAPGANRLLPRSRLNTLRTTSTTPSASLESSDETSPESKGEGESGSEAKSEPETTISTGGLNKIKSRPRLLVQPKTDNKPKTSPVIAAARKPNPLLARRKLALGGSTTESVAAAEEQPSEEAAGQSPIEKIDSDSNSSTTEDVKSEDNTELPETTTKQARGLGLLTQRRRLPIRKPGTQL
ncbi:mucin-5AC [Eupeodes corollae]|uniref:mucin-5AC n=1 Tax=Eupeodes corollae TaxID=290404 RepID=UPI002492DE01|nr:mucin-5AC [Eupeodes corollae]XP_055922533.1 mucin-5AC [Eupeodes corollae]XP_055922534.1 mucin-5AC [Eupeodes corollae]